MFTKEKILKKYIWTLKMQNKKVVIQFYLDHDTHEILRVEAKKSNRSISDWIFLNFQKMKLEDLYLGNKIE